MIKGNSLSELVDKLLSTPRVTEIIINDYDNVYIERDGEFTRLDVKIKKSDVDPYLIKVAKFNNTNYDMNHPIIDGSLKDGSRINIISSAYTNQFPAITIRRYLQSLKSFSDLEGHFGMDDSWIEFFRSAVLAKKNILVSGGTGMGKTTFLNLLLNEIPKNQRVVTIEDTRELSHKLPNSVSLLAQKSIIDVEKPLKTRDLLKNSLRMRPDRIIIGEVRGGEAFDLLQAMNTGHDGSMCTIHANRPPESLSRLENLFMFAGHDIPLPAIRHQVSTALDFIVQLGRDKSGRRLITSVAEVCKMEGDTILLQTLASSQEGKLIASGLVPTCFNDLKDSGLSESFFSKTFSNPSGKVRKLSIK